MGKLHWICLRGCADTKMITLQGGSTRRNHSQARAGVTAQLCQERLWVLFAGAEESCSCPAGLKETPAVGGVQELVLGLLEHIRKQ